MRLYAVTVWEGLTDNWHSGGTVLVEADRPSRAKRKVAQKYGIPEKNMEVAVAKEWDVFRDAGCC